MPLAAPAAKRSFKATVQKILMGKAVVSDSGGGKEKNSGDESRSGSSSAVGSRRGSDVAPTSKKPGDIAGTKKDQENQGVGSAMEAESGSNIGRRNIANEEDGGKRKTSDESDSVANVGGGTTSKNILFDESSPEDDLLKEFVQVDIERDSANHTSTMSSGENQPQSFVPTGTVCNEIKVEASQVKKLTEKEEDEQIFSFDVNDNDSEAEEAVADEDLEEVDVANLEEVNSGEKDDKSAFSKACRSTILTISPFLTSPLPYFETEEGKSSPNWAFFPPDIYWSAKLGENSADISQALEAAPSDDHDSDEVVYWSTDRCTHRIHSVHIAEPHPFTCLQLTEDFGSESTRALLADFRARGGRFIPKAPSAISGSAVPHAVTDPIEHNAGQIPQTSSQQYLLARKGGEEASGTNPDTQHHFPMEDCLDPYRHQKILLQFSSFSHHISSNMGHCIHPWIVTMKYYGHNDITLGMFLEKYCFNANYLCPNENCEMLMASHVRRFVHGNASIQILQRRLDSPVPGYSNKVLMWSWCRRCKQVTPVQPMSRDTWHMSFAKYLEIRFYGKDYRRRGTSSPCDHSLHHHHYQYFGQHNMVASFKYSPIILREIAFPPLPITIERPYRAHMMYYEESVNLAARGNQVFRGIHGNIASLTAAMSVQRLEQKRPEFISNYEADVARFKQQIEELEGKIAQVESHHTGAEESKEGKKSDDCNISKEDQLLDIEDSIVITKRVLSEIIFAWNSRFHDFLQQEKEVEKQRRKEGPMSGRKFSTDVDGGTPSSATKNSKTAFPFGLTPPLTPTLPMEQSSPVFINLPQPESSTERQGSGGSSQPTSIATLREREDSDVSPRGSLNFLRGSPLGRRSPQQQSSPKLRVDCDQQVTERRADLEASGSSSVSRDTSGQRDDDTLGIDDADGVDVGENCRGNDDEERDSLCSLNERDSTTTSGPPDDPVSPVPSSLSQSVDYSDQRSPAKTKPGAVKQLLNQFLTSHESTQIETPFPADQHHLLPPCSIVPITIYDQEPSSIIAYALSSEQYKTKIYEQQQAPGQLTPGNMSLGSGQGGSSNAASGQNSPATRRKMGGDSKGGAAAGPETKDLSRKIGQLKRKISQGVLMFQRTKSASGGLIGPSSSRDDWGVMLPASEALEEDGQDKLSTDDKLDDQITPHIELQFSDQTNTQFFCGVYFAAQFQELRKLIFPIGEDVYIRSLSRCMQWVARGGKSGLKFMKTLDDRLILKQMSRSEAHSFLKFAPNYFQYIQRAHNNKKPTALAKIIGFYKVGFHNPVTNTAQKLDLLVQENLFYKRNIAQVFDLKGSMRNRHVKTMGAQTQDLVLMDENLLKHIVDSPLYIRMHSKTALAMAIKADTEFLSSHLVMDYSLLVGLDKNTKELVVGIIDFIRTFTWDKKLETFVKSTSGKMPTVVSPELYRSRFLEAMDKYFLLVPDRWTGLGRDAYNEDWTAN
ncbi:1-phosphatidylinositol 3-phosphate 5-kinase-like [Diadema setosum]|uniref:1-phosphatidylinositol 3-phosphate 5-kinase-like n=1 Tax=Diadema setosum TaxID=31175 RepID=UPI003B3A902A